MRNLSLYKDISNNILLKEGTKKEFNTFPKCISPKADFKGRLC